jgi:hypothetical protein
MPTETEANAEEHADNRTEEVGSQHPTKHHLCRLYCLNEAVGWSLHGTAIILAGMQKSSFARRRLTPGEASPSQDRRNAPPIGFEHLAALLDGCEISSREDRLPPSGRAQTTRTNLPLAGA